MVLGAGRPLGGPVPTSVVWDAWEPGWGAYVMLMVALLSG